MTKEVQMSIKMELELRDQFMAAAATMPPVPVRRQNAAAATAPSAHGILETKT